MLDKKLDLSRTNVIEGTVGELSLRTPDGGKYGIFFDHVSSTMGMGRVNVCCWRATRCSSARSKPTAARRQQPEDPTNFQP
ncbi:MAG: hypothetical protein ACYTDW_21765 [Planctomycetota bacterium]